MAKEKQKAKKFNLNQASNIGSSAAKQKENPLMKSRAGNDNNND